MLTDTDPSSLIHFIHCTLLLLCYLLGVVTLFTREGSGRERLRSLKGQLQCGRGIDISDPEPGFARNQMTSP